MPAVLKDRSLFRQQCLINGQWCDADDKSVLPVTNPANEKQLGTVPGCGAAETRRAIEAASAAFPAWRALTPLQRGAYLKAWEQAIRENLENLAGILTLEEGKPLAEARGEILQGASYLTWYAEECRRICGDVTPAFRPGTQCLTRHEPVGVAAAITPWNFPFAMLPRKAAPALAAGCTIVIKPAGRTPYSALAQAELGMRVGIPAGVINVLTGSAAEISAEIASNPTVRKVSFTGSIEVGRRLAADCASTLKRMSLELGGNTPFLVFDDADLTAALDLAMACKFRNAGQTCICANRFLVQEGIYERFVEGLTGRVKALRVGDGLDPATHMGPLINARAVERVDGLVRDAEAKGARLLAGGHTHALGGNFYEPTLIADLKRDMLIFQGEVFGPVAAVMPFATEDEAVALANDTSYGLASYVCTRDLARSWRLFGALQYGMLGVNEVTLASAETPFGGVKFSGLGREGGREGLLEYMETHYLLLGGLA